MRCGVGPNQDMTGRNYKYALVQPDYAATIALATPQATETLVQPGQLTGAATITIDVTDAYLGDKVIILFKADGTGRTVTFTTGFKTSATVVVAANKFASIAFIFDGVQFVESGRGVTA